MDHPDQAIKYIEKSIVYIFANGSMIDQAKLHFLYAKCIHLLNRNKSSNFFIFLLNHSIFNLG